MSFVHSVYVGHFEPWEGIRHEPPSVLRPLTAAHLAAIEEGARKRFGVRIDLAPRLKHGLLVFLCSFDSHFDEAFRVALVARELFSTTAAGREVISLDGLRDQVERAARREFVERLDPIERIREVARSGGGPNGDFFRPVARPPQGPPEGQLPALIEALTDADVVVRRQATYELEAYGARASTATAALAAALRDVDDDVRLGAIDALAAIGPGAGAALGALVACLGVKGDHPAVTPMAAGALCTMGQAAVPVVASLLDREPGAVRDSIIFSSRSLGCDGQSLLPTLRQIADDKAEAPYTRQTARLSVRAICQALDAGET